MNQGLSRETSSASVLVVDDDIVLCEMLKEYLQPEGFEVDSVNDGDQGLEVARQGKHDIIILDLMLPRLNGFEFLKKLRRSTDTPVLMLTARDEQVHRILGLEMGADDFVTKPCNPRELTARLRAILRRSEARCKNTMDLKSEPVVVGDLSLDPLSRRVICAG